MGPSLSWAAQAKQAAAIPAHQLGRYFARLSPDIDAMTW
jgi:hypothetical protein